MQRSVVSVLMGCAFALPSSAQSKSVFDQMIENGHKAEAPAVASSATAQAGAVLTNESILKLVKGGLSDDVILGMVQTQPGQYKVDSDSVISLKQAGISDRIISSIVAAANGPAKLPSAPNGALEIGVYVRLKNGLRELNPEVVNWKTGGVVKWVATAHVVKQDINGRINRPHSSNELNLPAELLVYAPDGVAITEYQLIRLHEHSDAREFRTVTGGIFHVTGGSMRDEIDFEGIKTASRTYSIKLDRLQEGEYGLLPPGTESSSHASSSLGKMYTFRVIR